jgi:hypothetical protein
MIKQQSIINQRDTGFRGLWTFYGSTLADGPWRFTHYSGGLGTGFQQHTPLAVYCPQVNKTFFVYSGSAPDVHLLRTMIGEFDHATQMVSRPVILGQKETDDAHDNPSLVIDPEGRIIVFASAHGTMRPAYVYRSIRAFDIAAFEQLAETSFSYGQPWYVKNRLLFLHTRYDDQFRRSLFYSHGIGPENLSDPIPLANMERGHYQISWQSGTTVGTAFNMHPLEGGCCARTNLYFLQTSDAGETWQTVTGERVALPIANVDHPCRVAEYQSRGLQVFLKQIEFDPSGRPVILFLTTPTDAAGPIDGRRMWCTATWAGRSWRILEAFQSNNCYDYGFLNIDPDGAWRVLAPTGPGPQPFNCGGEVELIESLDQGTTWTRVRQVTQDSRFNHSYVRRPVAAHPDFAAFWADGHARYASKSRLYFCDRRGELVHRLPETMQSLWQTPERLTC